MAKGRRDYTWGFQIETATGARNTESFVKYGFEAVEYNVYTPLYTYVVPEGKRLAVNKVIFSTGSWDSYLSYIGINSVLQFHVKSSGVIMSDFSDQNPFYVTAGQEITAGVISEDAETCSFFVSIIGVLETL